MALLPPRYSDAIVAIERGTEKEEHRTVATGFLVGFLTGSKDDQGEPLYYLYLVTNRHVFDKEMYVWLRFNKSLGSHSYKLQLISEKGEKIWLAHTNTDVDIAVVKLNPDQLKADGINFEFIVEEQMAFRDVRQNEGITPGDAVFVLGFPMGLSGKEKNYVIIRSGIISRLDDEIIDLEKAFLIDAFIFPGNSGSPVFLKPELSSISGTNAVNRAYLLGVVSRNINYEDTAYSHQTNPPTPRISFVENSGLAFIVPIDYVRDVVRNFKPDIGADQVSATQK